MAFLVDWCGLFSRFHPAPALEGHYSDRLACSLDLVQWPTNPLWSEIPKEAQAKLLEDGRPFVELVLEKNPSIGLLLGNGHTVVRELEQAFS